MLYGTILEYTWIYLVCTRLDREYLFLKVIMEEDNHDFPLAKSSLAVVLKQFYT